jgi:hypothetical protein
MYKPFLILKKKIFWWLGRLLVIWWVADYLFYALRTAVSHYEFKKAQTSYNIAL